MNSTIVSSDDLPRPVLPIPDQPALGLTIFDAKDLDSPHPSAISGPRLARPTSC